MESLFRAPKERSDFGPGTISPTLKYRDKFGQFWIPIFGIPKERPDFSLGENSPALKYGSKFGPFWNPFSDPTKGV